eukprot:552006_1
MSSRNNKRRNNPKNRNKRKFQQQTSSKKVTHQSKSNSCTENENKINDTKTTHHCEFCDKAGISNRCGGCKNVYYCNQTCQSSDWPLHQSLCKFYQTDYFCTHCQIDNHLFVEKNLNKKKYYTKKKRS